jgi:crotonobetainyl-CoA:carnitine CoA-transferase CaiB-like acyl-CoA transferase
MPQVLSGIRVLDLTRLLPGGLCTLMLADLGAEVIKIEDPNGGDYLRWMPPLVDGLSAYFRALNRNKRSLILDLKSERGQAVLKRLTERADVLVEGFRPDVMKRLDCDYEALKAVNPRLVYCSISGWGADGPYANRSGHDLNYVSTAGLTGAMEQPQVMGGQIADMGGAYMAASGILAAFLKRERSGEGSHVDVSLFESSLPFGIYGWIEGVLTGAGGGQGGLTGGAACYRIYQTRDGKYVSLAALEPKFWSNFCTAIERPDLIPDYILPERQAYLRTELENIFALRTADEWQTRLKDADCCFALVNTPSAMRDDPQIQARGMVGKTNDGTLWMRTPIRISGDSFVPGDAPGYGADTREVLHESGFTETELEGLLSAGIVRA